jgi:hypothetical protein
MGIQNSSFVHGLIKFLQDTKHQYNDGLKVWQYMWWSLCTFVEGYARIINVIALVNYMMGN